MQTTIVAEIVEIERLTNTVNGNPRFKIHVYSDFQNAAFVTKPDTMASYKITRNERGTYRLTLDGRNRVVDLEAA